MLRLTPDKARIFRIVHVANVPWMLKHGGMSCRNSSERDPDFVSIGNPDLIVKRTTHPVPIAPGGTLGDYVPFYFTPCSIMMFNIITGRTVTRREKQDIVIFVSSIDRLRELKLSFVFTNQHASSIDVEFYTNIDNLRNIDWDLLQRRDFKTNDTDPGKQVRYQAEALVHQRVPLEAVLGICCYNDDVALRVQQLIDDHSAGISVKATPELYF